MILILNEQSTWLYPSILTDSLKMDYHFQIACVQPPPPQRKNRRRGVCGGGGDCTQHSALLMRFGSRSERVFFSDTPLKCLDRDCEWRRRIGTRHGNVYRSVMPEKNRKLLFVSNVFYKQLHICMLFH